MSQGEQDGQIRSSWATIRGSNCKPNQNSMFDDGSQQHSDSETNQSPILRRQQKSSQSEKTTLNHRRRKNIRKQIKNSEMHQHQFPEIPDSKSMRNCNFQNIPSSPQDISDKGQISEINTENQEKIVNEKLTCYVSAFNLSINDWFNEYENIQIFNRNLKQALGTKWIKALKTATKQSENIDSQFYHKLLTLYLTTQFQATNISEAQITKINFNQNTTYRAFLVFLNSTLNYATQTELEIKDMNLFEIVVRTFYMQAQYEYEMKLIKIRSDQHNKIRLTEAALNRFNQIQTKELHSQTKDQIGKQRESDNKSGYLGLDFDEIDRMGGRIPGFQMVKDKVLKPLMVATERVVEYCLKEDENVDEQAPDESQNSDQNLQTQFKKLHISGGSSIVGQKRIYRQITKLEMVSATNSQPSRNKRKMKNDNLKFDSRLLQKASAAVDLISQNLEFKSQMNQQVSGLFVTETFELTHDFIGQLEKQEREILQNKVKIATLESGQIPENLNLKFVKPSPNFYNKIMALWFKFNYIHSTEEINAMTASQLQTVLSQFCIEQFQQVGSWGAQLLVPLDNMIQIIAQEHCQLINMNEMDDEQLTGKTETAIGQISIYTFFNNVKAKLNQKWEAEIVHYKSSQIFIT